MKLNLIKVNLTLTEEMPLKKKNSIKVSAVGSRVFTLRDLVSELNSRGVSVSKITKLTEGNLDLKLS